MVQNKNITPSPKSAPKSKSFDVLKDMVEEDLLLTIDKTDVDALNTPTIFNKYHKEYRLVTTELMNEEIVLKRLYRELWLYYQGKGDPEFVKRVKNGINYNMRIERTNLKMFIEGDEDYLKQLVVVEMVLNKKNFLKRVLDQINQRNWHIRNAIETLKFKHGVN